MLGAGHVLEETGGAEDLDHVHISIGKGNRSLRLSFSLVAGNVGERLWVKRNEKITSCTQRGIEKEEPL